MLANIVYQKESRKIILPNKADNKLLNQIKLEPTATKVKLLVE